MKKMKRLKTYYSSFVILILFLASMVSLPDTIAFSATGDPTITIISPSTGITVTPKNLVISGDFTDPQQTSNLFFEAYDNSLSGTPISDSTNQSTEWTIDATNGKWSYTPRSGALAEGTHTIYITNNANNITPTSITITIDSKRPYISKTAVVFKGNTKYTVNTGDTLGSIAASKLNDGTLWTDIAKLNNLSSSTKDTQLTEGTILTLPTIRFGEDLTYLPPDSIIKVELIDNNPMNQLVSQIENTSNPYNPIKVLEGSTEVTGTTSILENDHSTGKYVYDVYFTPSVSLVLDKTYLAYLDSNLADDASNPIYAKFFKFTIKSNDDWDDIDNQTHDSSNPHGHYQLNSNMCAACHSTHVNSPYDKGLTDKLDPPREGGSYLITFNDKLNAKASENYCIACHDGTLNDAPAASGIEGTYHHNNQADYNPTTGTNNLKEATSCTSCHNPHLEWSTSNPNLLKDHYIYTHNSADLNQNGLTNLIVDSLDTSCETCHEDDAIHNNSTNTLSSIFVKNDQNVDGYHILQYKKSLTAEGTVSNKTTDPTHKTVLDYELCLHCHSANKSTTDIESYYTDANSGHNFTLPSDDGGSQLSGPMPCAECHETHGSNNIDMLRSQLGNIQTSSKYTSSGTTWTADNERNFCLECHNNSTEIYGKKASFNVIDSNGTPISGHQGGDTASCSSCHGSGSTDSDKFLSAAHDPKVSP